MEKVGEKVGKVVKRGLWETIIRAVIFVAIGVLFVVRPDTSGEVICYILGVAILVLGVINAIKVFMGKNGADKDPAALQTAVVELVGGLFVLLRSDLVEGILWALIGGIIVFNGAGGLTDALTCRKAGDKKWIAMTAIAAALVALGVICMFASFTKITFFVGISLIVSGLADIVSMIAFKRAIERATMASAAPAAPAAPVAPAAPEDTTKTTK